MLLILKVIMNKFYYTQFLLLTTLLSSPSYGNNMEVTDLDISRKAMVVRNIKNANRYFNNMNIYDYLYLNNLLKLLIENNLIDKYKNLVNKYNIKYDGIESIMKIDKIQKTKINISSAIKKILLN